jgi:hypothetical protein
LLIFGIVFSFGFVVGELHPLDLKKKKKERKKKKRRRRRRRRRRELLVGRLDS